MIRSLLPGLLPCAKSGGRKPFLHNGRIPDLQLGNPSLALFQFFSSKEHVKRLDESSRLKALCKVGFYNSSPREVLYRVDSKSLCLAVQTFIAPVPRNLPRFGFRFRVLGFRMFQPKGCYGSRVFRFRASGCRVQCNLFVRGLPQYSPDVPNTNTADYMDSQGSPQKKFAPFPPRHE